MQRFQETCAATKEGCSVLEELCATTDYFLMRLQMAESVPSAEGRVSVPGPVRSGPGRKGNLAFFAEGFCVCLLLKLPLLWSQIWCGPSEGGL